MSSRRLRGALILLTGAGGGIGQHILRGLLERGAFKVYAATRAGAAVLSDPRVIPVQLDITSDADVAQAAARCNDVTLLINNAGVNHNTSFVGSPDMQAARTEMETNYFGTLRMCRAFTPALTRNEGGIVNVISMAAHKAIPAMGSLCASKAAELRMTECLRQELAGRGVTVMGFLPGAVETSMTRHLEGVPKLTPRAAADALLDGWEAGEETVSVLPPAR